MRASKKWCHYMSACHYFEIFLDPPASSIEANALTGSSLSLFPFSQKQTPIYDKTAVECNNTPSYLSLSLSDLSFSHGRWIEPPARSRRRQAKHHVGHMQRFSHHHKTKQRRGNHHQAPITCRQNHSRFFTGDHQNRPCQFPRTGSETHREADAHHVQVDAKIRKEAAAIRYHVRWTIVFIIIRSSCSSNSSR